MDATMVCPCPPKDGEARHPEGDTVTLRDTLDFRTVVTIRKSRQTIATEDDAVRLAERLAVFTEFYMLMGIERWTFVDEEGKPVPVSHKAIRERLFTAPDVESVSEVAEELYNPVVLLPLVDRVSSSSPPTPTESTSPISSPPNRPTPLKPSSTSISRTAGTVTTTSLPDGDSSSSPRSVSAA